MERAISMLLLYFCLANTVTCSQVKLTAAGQVVQIGDLYDSTKSVFVGQNIFGTTNDIQNATLSLDVTQSDTKFEVVDSLSEKINLLDVELSLALDITLGTVKSSGALSNLHTHLKNGKRKEAWVLHQIRTVQQTLNLPVAHSNVEVEILQNTSATHFVLGIQYGADLLFKFVGQEFERKTKQEIKAELELEINSENHSNHSKYLTSVFSDVFLPAYPRNIHDVLRILGKDLQSLISQVNFGRGKPIKYILVPLNDIKYSFWRLYSMNFKTSHQINDSVLQSVVATMEEIAVANQKFNEISASFESYMNSITDAHQQELQRLKLKFENSVFDFKQNLTASLENAKVTGDSNKLGYVAQDQINIFEDNKFRIKLENLTRESGRKIQVYDNFITHGVEYVGKSQSFEAIRWQTMDQVLLALFYNLELIDMDEIMWQKNSHLMFGPLKKITNRLVIVDCDYHLLQCRGLNKTVIREYRHGVLTPSSVTAESSITNGDQCLFEKLALDSLQKKFHNLEESSKEAIDTLNGTIADLRRNRNEHYSYDLVAPESQSRTYELLVAREKSKWQNISDEFLNKLLNQPKARLYSGENLTSQYEEYSFVSSWNKPSCFNLVTLNQRIKSVNTFGTCIRLFELMDCAGWSLAVYPGSGNGLNLDAKLDGIYSAGPCLTNEFDNSFSYDLMEPGSSGPITVVVKPETNTSEFFTPDWLLFGGVSNYMDSYQLWDKENPITNFKQGTINGRIEYIRAFISHVHLRNEIQVEDLEMSSFTRRLYEQLEKKESDIVGYAVPLKYGGSEDEIYNIFPQRPECQTKWLEELDEALTDNMAEGFHGLATIYLNFLYPNNNASRPNSFVYHISINGQRESGRVRYGIIEN